LILPFKGSEYGDFDYMLGIFEKEIEVLKWEKEMVEYRINTAYVILIVSTHKGYAWI
jgi:hypothetical protein